MLSVSNCKIEEGVVVTTSNVFKILIVGLIDTMIFSMFLFDSELACLYSISQLVSLRIANPELTLLSLNRALVLYPYNRAALDFGTTLRSRQQGCSSGGNEQQNVK